MKLSLELLKALTLWQQENPHNRSIDISVRADLVRTEFDNNRVKVWVFDFEFMNGFFVCNIEDIPTRQTFIDRQKETLAWHEKQLQKQKEKTNGKSPT